MSNTLTSAMVENRNLTENFGVAKGEIVAVMGPAGPGSRRCCTRPRRRHFHPVTAVTSLRPLSHQF